MEEYPYGERILLWKMEEFIFRNCKTKMGEPKAFCTRDLSLLSGKLGGERSSSKNRDQELKTIDIQNGSGGVIRKSTVSNVDSKPRKNS